MIVRSKHEASIREALERSRVVALIGPRQCGKTTLARLLVAPESPNYFDLEDPLSLARLDEPMTALRDLRGLIVIDEIQRKPEIFPILRVLADRVPLPAKFLVLGSATPHLLRQTSESLAGRIEIVMVEGFTLEEVGAHALQQHWNRGGFPLSFLAASEKDSSIWRKNFIQTILERDLPSWGIYLPSTALYRFWAMLAHYHGQLWNAAEPAQSLGVSQSTVRRYLDILTNLFMVRQLQPLQVNIGKRQVKSPKMYVRDCGLLHTLLGISSEKDLLLNPKCGASWEGYVLEEAIKAIRPDEAYFWATHNGAEIDLVVIINNRRFGIECKRADAPKITPSMRTALSDLSLEHIAVVYPGPQRYPLSEKITAVPVQSLAEGRSGLFSQLEASE